MPRNGTRIFLASIVALAACLGCAQAQERAAPLGLPAVPAQIAGTPAMQKLGEKLFFDRSLSVNGAMSCAMCHIPSQGYASNQSALSIGMEGRSLRRNAPSLYNVVFKHYLFHDGRENNLAAQVWGPLLAPDEMGNPAIGPLLDRLRDDPLYGRGFDAAFPGEGVSMTTLGRAVAAYKSTLLRGESRFDRAFFGGDRTAMTAQEWRGYEIFSTKGGCADCPSVNAQSALFTDQSFHNTGVAFQGRPSSDMARVELAPGVVKEIDLSAVGLHRAEPRNDIGRFEITRDPAHRWTFATPMLRGVKDSWPYMHDGSLQTLEAVIDFYDRGGGANPSLDPRIRPLGLSEEEKACILAFLRAL